MRRARGPKRTMIEIEVASKRFMDTEAVRDVTLTVPDGEVFGLVGTNGAGKSTLLRMIAGVLRPDSGAILVDGEPVWENPAVKAKIAFLPDEAYFFPDASAEDMAGFYAAARGGFDLARFRSLTGRFGLGGGRPVRTYSKGMRKQLSVLLGLCSGAKYLLCDETFDGLDPVMRQAVKSLFAGDMVERGLTPVVASHNLRELEDICDRVGLLHRGGILLSEDLSGMKENMHKIQCVIPDAEKEAALISALSPLSVKRQGSLRVITARGERQEILRLAAAAEPAFFEVLPLSLEEIFIGETEAIGYEIADILG